MKCMYCDVEMVKDSESEYQGTMRYIDYHCAKCGRYATDSVQIQQWSEEDLDAMLGPWYV